jgi:hypothetical protein
MSGATQTSVERVTARWARRFFVLTFPFFAFVGFEHLRELQRNQSRQGLPLVAGTVLSTRLVHTNALAVRPELTIRVDGTHDTVVAILSSNAASGIPTKVSFHYSGNRNEEVFLEQERSPLVPMLIAWLLPLTSIAFCSWVLSRGEKRSLINPPQP